MGTYCHLLQGKIGACFFYPAFQIIDCFQSGMFGSNQTEHNHLVRRHRLQRQEGPGTLVIILQQKSLGVYTLKYRLGDEIVTTFDQPTAALVASSKMKAERHLGEAIHDGIVHFDPPGQVSVHRPTSLLVKLARLGIQQKRVVGSVDLDISGA